MFKCHICGSTKAHRELVSEVFQIDGEPVLVQNILQPLRRGSICQRNGRKSPPIGTRQRETGEIY